MEFYIGYPEYLIREENKMGDWFSKFSGKTKSAGEAKERLKLILIHDRTDITATTHNTKMQDDNNTTLQDDNTTQDNTTQERTTHNTTIQDDNTQDDKTQERIIIEPILKLRKLQVEISKEDELKRYYSRVLKKIKSLKSKHIFFKNKTLKHLIS